MPPLSLLIAVGLVLVSWESIDVRTLIGFNLLDIDEEFNIQLILFDLKIKWTVQQLEI